MQSDLQRQIDELIGPTVAEVKLVSQYTWMFIRQDMATETNQHLIHVHVCIRCGHMLRREEADSKGQVSGMIECPSCGESSPLNVQVEDANGQVSPPLKKAPKRA